jgi:hypothetical protein
MADPGERVGSPYGIAREPSIEPTWTKSVAFSQSIAAYRSPLRHLRQMYGAKAFAGIGIDERDDPAGADPHVFVRKRLAFKVVLKEHRFVIQLPLANVQGEASRRRSSPYSGPRRPLLTLIQLFLAAPRHPAQELTSDCSSHESRRCRAGRISSSRAESC